MITNEQLARFTAEIPSTEWLTEHGYTGPQQYAYAITSDAHKDAFGIRCRWMALATVEELAALYYECVDAMIADRNAEREAEAAAAREEQEHVAAVARILSTRSTFNIGQFWPA